MTATQEPQVDGLPGLDPRWSRTVEAPDADGVKRTWHLLDNGAEPVHGTVLCVHGNPTWSYLWRRLFTAVPDGWRIVAPDHLGMGWSERTEEPRDVAQRVADLGALTDALGIDGPVVTVGHDWGGMISLGWALEHQDQVRAVVLGNTAVAQPPGDAGPPLIRLAHLPGVRPFGCELTPIFVRATTALSQPPLPRDVRDAFAAPYRGRHRRRGVADFVADIPFSPGHPSYDTVYGYAERLHGLDAPVLMLWGPRDPVFGEVYLRDLQERLPQAQVHRYEGASHLVTEDAPEYAEAVAAWLTDLDTPGAEPPTRADVRSAGPSPAAPSWDDAAGDEGWTPWTALRERAHDTSPALDVGGESVSWAALSQRVDELAAGFAAAGVRPGDRVGLLVEPSSDLVSVVYAVWRAGAVVVVVDKGLGLKAMRRALRGARLQHVVAGDLGLVAARAMGLPGSLTSVTRVPRLRRRALGIDHDLDGLAALGRRSPAPAEPGPDADCAVLFTSGATGPAKGVVYRHRHFRAQVELVRRAYDLGPDDRFVAAFAPFALLGPALGLASAVPAIDVTRPDQLTAPLLADAVDAVDARVVFASPAALRRVVATRDELTGAQRAELRRVRLLMSAGAPVPRSLLHELGAVLPQASLHTPYGMTEALPVTDVSLEEIEAAGAGDGVCVGRPLTGVEVAIGALGAGPDELTTEAGVAGEICVRGPHVKDRYDARWATQRASSRPAGWHRTGDVGHVDDEGRLWVEGRLPHVVTTADGVRTPVGIEQRVEALADVRAAAAVGVGPAGTQVLVVVVVPSAAPATEPSPRRTVRLRVADTSLADLVRDTAGVPVAAVLVADRLPLDIRHASKVDRTAVAEQAARLLGGTA